ncbi:hypothetical protein KNO81_42080, partial [Paraburkholderia sediminicola]|nr:hypothetical protein [Paraburkholderia sediminicola]
HFNLAQTPTFELGGDIRHLEMAMTSVCCIGMFGTVAFFWHPATAAQGFQPDSAQRKRPRMRRNGSCRFFLAKHYSGVNKR